MTNIEKNIGHNFDNSKIYCNFASKKGRKVPIREIRKYLYEEKNAAN